MRNLIFYGSYYEAIKELPESEQGKVYKAIMDYAMEKIEPKLVGIPKAIFTLIRPTLDASIKNYENGKKGGRPKTEIETELQTETETQSKTQTITQRETETQTDIIFDKEKEKENKNDKDYNEYPCRDIMSSYNDTCISFPRVTVMSNSRKKAIKARLNSGYKFEDFIRLFEIAESCEFLKGKNNRNWSANFDWLIKDANMAKVLDGNFKSKNSKNGTKNNSDGNFVSDFREMMEGQND